MSLEEIIAQLSRICGEAFTDYVIVSAEAFHTKRGVSDLFECRGNVSGKAITLQIGLDNHFPYTLPKIFLKEKSALGTIPHLEEDGYICYLSPEGLLLDFEKPAEIICECLLKASKVLEDGANGNNLDDFYNEFEAFWRRAGEVKRVVNLVDPSTDTNYHSIYVWNIKNDVLLFCDSPAKGAKYAKIAFNADLRPEDVQRGYFLKLRPGTRIRPVQIKAPLHTRVLRSILKNNLSGSVKRQYFNAIRRRTIKAEKNEYLLLAIPQPNGYLSLIGVEFSNINPRPGLSLGHPLERSERGVRILPLAIERHYQHHLLERTSGDYGLKVKKVALLGAGAIGSRIAGELIRAGISDLTIIDNDIFSADNLYRHELGVTYLDADKARGVATRLNYYYPLVDVSHQNANILTLLETCPDTFERFDLVISALGNPTVEMLLNEKMHMLSKPPKLVFVWVEPLGIGGHVLATLNNDKSGCYECLFTDPARGNSERHNRSAFAAPGQVFSKSVAGCGTQFTPYGSLDALQSAILATRVAINILTGTEEDNPLLSWKGDDTSFLAAGFKKSGRYELSAEQLYEQRYSYKAPRCTTCNHHKAVKP